MPDPTGRPTALVTGASRGIGAAVARALASTHDVRLGGRDGSALATVAADLPGARPWPVDLTDPEALAVAVDGIDRLDVLVHAAGIGPLGTVADTPASDWRRTYEVNVVAVAELTRLLLPALRAAGGRVVLVNSGAGFTARPGWGAYAASKFALRAFADALRAEEASHGVRVTSVHPGRTDTEMQRGVVAHEGGTYRPDAYLRPRSVAAAVLFAVTTPPDADLTELSLRPSPPLIPHRTSEPELRPGRLGQHLGAELRSGGLSGSTSEPNCGRGGRLALRVGAGPVYRGGRLRSAAMDERGEPAVPDGGRPPAVRVPADPAPWRAAWDASPPGAGAASGGGGRPGSPWRRIVRTSRGGAGLGIAAAALLLWPFAGWSWWPWAVGAGVLVMLRLLRLDRLLRGWMWHVGGLGVVVGLMLSTGPWAWALAVSIGVLLAGLVQLPLWRLAAVGVAMCLVSGLGFGISLHRTAEETAAQQAQTQLQNRGQLGAPRPTAVLPVLLNNIARGDAGAVCTTMLSGPVRVSFAAAAGQPDCAAAVRALGAQVVDPTAYAQADARSVRRGDQLDVDACQLRWPGRPAAGPQLGRLTVGRAESGTTYVVTAFAPC